jgi:hypothetical protein
MENWIGTTRNAKRENHAGTVILKSIAFRRDILRADLLGSSLFSLLVLSHRIAALSPEDACGNN